MSLEELGKKLEDRILSKKFENTSELKGYLNALLGIRDTFSISDFDTNNESYYCYIAKSKEYSLTIFYLKTLDDKIYITCFSILNFPK